MGILVLKYDKNCKYNFWYCRKEKALCVSSLLCMIVENPRERITLLPFCPVHGVCSTILPVLKGEEVLSSEQAI